jgi:transcription initiation factor IIF auxiliary subunit
MERGVGRFNIKLCVFLVISVKKMRFEHEFREIKSEHIIHLNVDCPGQREPQAPRSKGRSYLGVTLPL